MLLQFPKRHSHARASAGSEGAVGARAAKPVIIWGDNPAWIARSQPKMEDHHSAGMVSRCHHFETAEAPAPMSAARASLDGQSSITERNEVKSDMEASLGHMVLKCKAKVSYDYEQVGCQNGNMADRMSETEEKLAFIRRVRLARQSRYPTQNPMLTILEIDQGTYKQYETRTPLPHRYIPKFCAATGVSLVWLLTGEGKGPITPEIPRETPKRMGARPRGKAA